MRHGHFDISTTMMDIYTDFARDKTLVYDKPLVDNKRSTLSTPETNILKTIPITEGQLEIWVVCTLGGHHTNCSYNLGSSITVKGYLDTQLLTRCLEKIVRSHEILRSTFSSNGKYIHIHAGMRAEGNHYDISNKTEDEKAEFISSLNDQDKETAYDLENGPLFRYYLVSVSENEHLLKLGAHHIVCDGWSWGVILQDIVNLYLSYLKGERLISLKADSYADYALALQEFQKTEEYKNQELFWLDQYKGEIPVLNLPTDNPRPLPRNYECERRDHRISGLLYENIKNLRRQNRASTATILISAFETYLFRLTNQTTVTLAMPTAGQVATSNYRLVGHCVNLLPLKSHHDGKLSFLSYVNKRKPELIEAYTNQRVTYGSLLNKLNIPRDSSRIPLVPVMLSIINNLEEIDSLAGVAFEIKNDTRKYDNFEISVLATISNESISLEWTYNKHLFSAERVDRMITQFEALLIGITENPNQEISAIPLETKCRKRSVSEHRNLPLRNSTFTSLFAESVSKYPSSTAIAFGPQTITYEKLNRKSNQVAWYLRENGINRGDIVAISVERSLEMIVTMIGILKAGAAYLPLDPQYPAKRIEYMLEDSNANLLIKCDGATTFYTVSNQLSIDDIFKQVDKLSSEELPDDVLGNDLAYILYTSGSTGLPKGVMIEHHSLSNFLISFQKTPGISSTDRIVANTTISFDIAVTELLLPLISGAEIHLVTTNTARNGEELIRYIKENSISIVQATPTSWQMMINAGWEEALPIKVLCGGEALTKKLAQDLLQRVDELWNVYGPTETTVWSSVKKITNFLNPITIGKPIDNTQIYILDKALTVVDDGSTGELYIAGEGLARGYLNRPELTSEKFISNPFDKNPESKIYATGDMGRRLDNGEIICLGRKDSQIKIRGHRIELEEIESALASIAGVQAAVVIPETNDPDAIALIAFLKIDEKFKEITHPDTFFASVSSDLTTYNVHYSKVEEIRLELMKRLPSFMIPSEFLAIDTFPKTNSGKIDRKGFPTVRQTRPLVDAKSSDQGMTETEALILDVWSQALSIKNVDINTDFFEMGGHSLMAIRLISELNEITGIKLPLSILFENSTIKKLAKLIDEFEAPEDGKEKNAPKEIKFDALVPIKPSGSKKPIYLVHGLGLNVMIFEPFSKFVDWEQPVYGLQGIASDTAKDEDFTIEYLAKKYIQEIIRFDPQGPYIIAGYSFGGVLAYEMVNQLRALGKEIKMLGILDTDIVTEYAVKENPVKEFLKKIMFHTKFLIKYPTNVKRRIYRELGIKPQNTLKVQTEAQNDFFTENALLSGRYKRAYNEYVFRPSSTSIHLFRAKQRGYYLPDGKYYGWELVAKEGVYTYDIPGNHATCFLKPNVARFAQTLQQAIDNLEVEEK